MILKINYDKCSICKACIEICPVNAILDKENMVDIDLSRCIKCKTCVVACPNKAISIK